MLKRTTLAKSLLIAFGGSAALSFSGGAGAQQAPAPVQELQRVEITGSSIKRIDGETALPVQIITRKDIEKTGATTVEQLMQTVSAASSSGGLTAASVSGATTGGISAVGLRGLGSLRTLVLINGRRIAPYGIGFTNDSVSVDINSIPLAAVERVEVLKDGASAVYGSDAIAGVINFILRKDYTGADIYAQYGDTTQGGAAFKKITGSWGKGNLSADGYNVMVVANYQKEDALFGRQRSFADHAANVEHGNDSSSSATFPANFYTLDTFTKANPGAAQGCPGPWSYIDPLSGGDVKGKTCHFNPAPFVQLVPEAERMSLFASGRFAFTSDIEGYVEASYNRNKQNNIIQPSPLGFIYGLPPTNSLANTFPYNAGYALNYASVINMTSSSPYYPAAYVKSITGGATPDLTILYRDEANGLRNLTDTAEAPRLTFGVKGTAAGWDFDANFLHSESKVTESLASGFPVLSQLLPILNSGNFNFWGANTDAMNAQVMATNFVGNAFVTQSALNSIQAKGSRDLMQLPAGPLSMALGAEFRNEKYNFQSSAQLALGDIAGYGGSIASVDKSRNVESVFGELSIPILKNLDADLAVRYDRYQNVGSSTTPKASLRYQPMKELLFRGSVGNGFRAPSLADLYTPATTGVSTTGLSDPLRCPTTQDSTLDCSVQFNTSNGGSATLNPEKATTATVGFVLEPSNNFSLAVDYFKIDLTNAIANGVSASYITSSAALTKQYSYLITRNTPTAADIAAGIPGNISNINQLNINIGGQRLAGLDFDAKLRIPAGSLGTFTVSYTGTYFITNDSQNPDGTWSPGIDQANTSTGGNIPRLKTYLSLNLASGPWNYTLAQNWQTGYEDAPGSVTGQPNQMGPVETYDGQIQYFGFKNLRLTMGVRNLLNRAPPYANSPSSFQSGYDPQVADPRGRFVYAGVNYRFD